MSPGLRATSDKAAATVPFAPAAALPEDLAGVRPTVKRVERAADVGVVLPLAFLTYWVSMASNRPSPARCSAVPVGGLP